jgi:hypothetical protein
MIQRPLQALRHFREIVLVVGRTGDVSSEGPTKLHLSGARFRVGLFAKRQSRWQKLLCHLAVSHTATPARASVDSAPRRSDAKQLIDSLHR